MSVFAIIPAAGAGRRMSGETPKLLLTLGGRPVLAHTLSAFEKASLVEGVVVVASELTLDACRREVVERFGFRKVSTLVLGGAERQDSVRAGLEATRSPLVLVHDAARPLVTPQAIRNVARAAHRHGAAVLASPAVDTVKIVNGRGRVVDTPDRARVWLAQTPQGFRRRVLETAYRRNGRRDATDDVQLVERAGGRVVVVPGNGTNFKVTTREDLLRAEKVLDTP
jgi:2-C-methyl-D-erythritol 4-phosphate cytidylyltransferase